jgi:serine/threonine protein kinase
MTNIPDNRNALPTGYRLNDYQIQKVLGDGGFGITYLANETQLNAPVAIKEYLPNEIAVREGNSTVQPKSQKDTENFAWGLERFLEEARILAQFKHPNIVRVLRFFQANNTAYIVMEYEQGQSLANLIKDGETATEEEINRILPPLLDGLAVVHNAGYLHQDIKLDNIYLRTADNSPVLIGFGAARYEAGSRSRSVTTLVTPGYTAFEQYETKSNRLGAWTDIYALGAVLYRLISGKIPTESPERIGALMRYQPDPLTPAVEIGQGRYSQPLLEAIDWAVQINENDRPQTVQTWRDKLLAIPAPLPVPSTTITPTPVSGWKPSVVMGMVAVFLLLAIVIIADWKNSQTKQHQLEIAQLQAEYDARIAENQEKLLELESQNSLKDDEIHRLKTKNQRLERRVAHLKQEQTRQIRRFREKRADPYEGGKTLSRRQPQQAHRNTDEERRRAVKLVRDYYTNIDKGYANSAIRKWKYPPSKLRAIIANTDWCRISKIVPLNVTSSDADISIDVTCKDKGKAPKRWGVTFKLEKVNGDWKITKVASPLIVVEAYFNNINKNDVDSVIRQWQKPNEERLRSFIAKNDWCKKPEVELTKFNSSYAEVSVDVTCKDKGDTPKKWRLTVKLKRVMEKWKITHIKPNK